ncbi:MAG: hypothetical protein A2V98_14635 [Planctomycetes bacterium RBG_16_64_12]|nr:MAG: hypothetical protein A2V98_14635 [Planctomycetes bacterium RBG_16_64_12]
MLSPEQSLQALVPRPGFKVERMAAEPLVMDPVDVAWGPDGKMWVVEMADYPLGLDDRGKPGGRVRFLEDTDADGRYDRSTLFLENLNFPNGVMPWRQGVLVTCAPEIFYAEDTDGDGKADLRQPVLVGFGEGNQQHRVNHLRWGLDNWVYAANGDGGAGANGVVKSVRTGETLDIRGRDLRFRPGDGSLDVATGQAQFGRDRDDWGNWFGSNNNDPGWHYALVDHYIRRNPYVAAPPARISLTEARTAYPAGRVVTHHTIDQPAMLPEGQPGHFTSLGGMTCYRDDLFGLPFLGNYFVSDSVFNVVHRMTVWPRGATFFGERARDEQRSEFLASKDPYFRCSTLRTGPDGALWVVDMYRVVIEHPEWINDDLERLLDLRAGHERGRIYRVYPEHKSPRPIPRLDRFDTLGLVAALDHPNGWQRDLAQQMLVWRRDMAAVEPLEQMVVSSPRALARLHALCTLDGLGALRAEIVRQALVDRHPGVRRHAVRLSEPFLASSPALGGALLKLVDDLDPQVHMQLAYSLGEWNDPLAGQALAQLAFAHADDPYLSAAVMSSATPHLSRMIAQARSDSSKTAAGAQLLGKLLKLADDMEAWPDAAAALDAARRRPISQWAEKLLAQAKPSEAVQEALEKYDPVLEMAGDPDRGKQVFVEATCSTCHRLGDVGRPIGPDLRALVDRSPQFLHVAVIDPNRAVVRKYQEYTAVTADGLTLSGMLLEETSTSITLVDLGGQSQVILRKDLEELVCLGRSHMPQKLEAKLDLQRMADLFAFIGRMGPPAEQARPPSPEPVVHKPELVTAEPDGSLRLLARKSEIHGRTIRFDPVLDLLAWYRDRAEDYVAWSVDVPEPGSYEVWIEWAQVDEYAGNPFAVEVEGGASRVTGTLPSTGGWQRYRKESFGTLEIDSGRQRILVRPNGPIAKELSDLREIHLVPVARLK